MCSSGGGGQDAVFAVYLDYGIDSYVGCCADLVLNERGIIFKSRWRFALGTQLAIRVCAHPSSPDECAVCEDLTGMVVSCERLDQNRPCFEVTILFLDVTEPAQEELGRLADRLELSGHWANEKMPWMGQD